MLDAIRQTGWSSRRLPSKQAISEGLAREAAPPSKIWRTFSCCDRRSWAQRIELAGFSTLQRSRVRPQHGYTCTFRTSVAGFGRRTQKTRNLRLLQVPDDSFSYQCAITETGTQKSRPYGSEEVSSAPGMASGADVNDCPLLITFQPPSITTSYWKHERFSARPTSRTMQRQPNAYLP